MFFKQLINVCTQSNNFNNSSSTRLKVKNYSVICKKVQLKSGNFPIT